MGRLCNHRDWSAQNHEMVSLTKTKLSRCLASRKRLDLSPCRYFIFDKRSTVYFDSGLSGGAIASPLVDITIHDTENVLGVR
jgi:hypothetical protein